MYLNVDLHQPRPLNRKTQSSAAESTVAWTSSWPEHGYSSSQVNISSRGLHCLLLLVSCFRNAGLLSSGRDCLHECLSTFRSGYFPGEDSAEHHVFPVNGASGVIILLNHCSLQRDAGERAPGA